MTVLPSAARRKCLRDKVQETHKCGPTCPSVCLSVRPSVCSFVCEPGRITSSSSSSRQLRVHLHSKSRDYATQQLFARRVIILELASRSPAAED